MRFRRSVELSPCLDALHAALCALPGAEDRDSCQDELQAVEALRAELRREGEPAAPDAARRQRQHDTSLGLVAV